MEWSQYLFAAVKKVGPMVLTDSEILPTDNAGQGIPGFFKDYLLPEISNFVLGAAISIAVLMVMVGGVMFIYSGGDQEKRTKGRDIIIWAMVGLGVAIFSYGAVKALLSLDYLTK